MGAVLSWGGCALAQSAGLTPSQFPVVDQNGVDLTTGQLVPVGPGTSVGPIGSGGLSRDFIGPGVNDSFNGFVDGFSPEVTVVIGSTSKTFIGLQDGSFVPAVQDGSVLQSDGQNAYALQDRDGTIYYFDRQYATTANGPPQLYLVLRPSGEKLTYHFGTADASCLQGCMRLLSITSNLGYMVKYDYAGDTPASGSQTLTKVTAINLADDYCDPDANGCTTSRTWNAITFSGPTTGTGTLTATDSLNRTTTYSLVDSQIRRITLPSGVTDSMVYDDQGRVTQVFNGVGAWNYTYVSSASGLQVTVEDPLHHKKTITSNGANQVTSVIDALNRTTTYSYDPNKGFLSQIILPEGGYTSYGYDDRGNVTSITKVPKPGSSLANHLTTAIYPTTCDNPKTCNQPTSVTDGGATTIFTYNPNNGAVASTTSPADVNGVQAVMTYTYQPHTASFLNASGAMVPADSAVYELDQTSICRTQTTCSGTADEVRTVYSYAGSPTNLEPASMTQQDGTGQQSAVTAYTYNIFGDVRTVDGPLPGTVDTIRYRYDTARQKVGFVGVDPDAPDSGQPSLAIRYDYTPDGRLGDIKYGTVASQSDTDWLAFAKVKTVGYLYDSVGRVDTEFVKTFPGGVSTTQQVAQYSYDVADRTICTTIRMNPATFGSLPADACTPGPQGSDGPDRVTQNAYDDADELISVTSGVGAPGTRTETRDYTPDGLPQHLTDGDGNLTTVAYDGFDRISKTSFPSPTTPGISSPTDFTQKTYDATSWDLSQEQLRDGVVVTYHHDARHRLLDFDVPSLTTYGYDNLDHLISATNGGTTVSSTYDSLGRATQTNSPTGSMGYGYDLAGNRTQVTWPDGFFVNYDRDPTGEVTAIRENGAASGAGVLASYAYDRINRTITLTRGDGAKSTYVEDALGRVATLNHDLAGTANDQSIAFTFNAAGQINSRTPSIAGFGATGFGNRNGSYQPNGLNQYTTAAGKTLQWGGLGNLRSDGVNSYTYDGQNRLIGSGSGASLSYDPVGRLSQVATGSATTKFLYDDVDLVAEYDTNGVLQHRYVHGPGLDQPLVAYDASGNRSWLVADERGSIIGQADASGALTSSNSYDEYGYGPSNQGRFQYTGQIWIPEAGVYHYKARDYSPTLGRFLQTDPKGYAAGANLYAYVGDDPLNAVDPSGLDCDMTPPPSLPGEVEGIVICPYVPPINLQAILHDYIHIPNINVNIFGSGANLLRRLIFGSPQQKVCAAVTALPAGMGIYVNGAANAVPGAGIAYSVREELVSNGKGGAMLTVSENAYAGPGVNVFAGVSTGLVGVNTKLPGGIAVPQQIRDLFPTAFKDALGVGFEADENSVGIALGLGLAVGALDPDNGDSASKVLAKKPAC
jgi:RHS repeat-associated protein